MSSDNPQVAKLKSEVLKDAEFLKDFTEKLIRYINEGGVLPGMVIATITETAGHLAYHAGQYNQTQMRG